MGGVKLQRQREVTKCVHLEEVKNAVRVRDVDQLPASVRKNGQ